MRTLTSLWSKILWFSFNKFLKKVFFRIVTCWWTGYQPWISSNFYSYHCVICSWLRLEEGVSQFCCFDESVCCWGKTNIKNALLSIYLFRYFHFFHIFYSGKYIYIPKNYILSLLFRLRIFLTTRKLKIYLKNLINWYVFIL